MWSLLPSLEIILIAVPALIRTYFVTGLVGFGSALVAAPILAQRLPVADIVALFAMLDCVSVVVNGIRLRKKIDANEILRLIPFMIVGSVLGIWLILAMPQRPSLIALGLFVTFYAIYTLIVPPLATHFSRAWAIPFGTMGGVLSAMFGAGGFVYAAYLSRRLSDKDALRATLIAVIGLSNITRFLFFSTAGVYTDGRLPFLALCASPFLLIGLFVGHRLAGFLNREHFIRVVCVVLIVSGGSLIVRALYM